MRFSENKSSSFAALTPYLIPPHQSGRRANLGDGFILKAIERHVGKIDPSAIMTKRSAPRQDQLEILQERRVIILAGANQLRDNFAPWPGLTATNLAELDIALVPMGIGLDGNPKRNREFTQSTKDLLEQMHQKIEFSSWRCPRTVALLSDAMPHLAEQFLMTGCPVVYDDYLLDGTAFQKKADRIAVTVTERGDFFDREYRTLEAAAKLFPNSKRSLVLHQNFSDSGSKLGKALRRSIPGNAHRARAKLYAAATKLGYEIVLPQDVSDVLAFYEKIDLHIGSRLHAHLTFLSCNKWSFLTYVDDRCVGFSDFLGFPIIKPEQLESHMSFDFETVRKNAIKHFETMSVFLQSLSRI